MRNTMRVGMLCPRVGHPVLRSIRPTEHTFLLDFPSCFFGNGEGTDAEYLPMECSPKVVRVQVHRVPVILASRTLGTGGTQSFEAPRYLENLERLGPFSPSDTLTTESSLKDWLLASHWLSP